MKRIITLLLLLLFASCGEEQFGGQNAQTNEVANPIQTNSSTLCSAFTLIRPQVDFLFLFDNSTSSVFIDPGTRQALNQTVQLISNNFDFHILLAPLLVQPGADVNSQAILLASTPDGLSTSALGMQRSPDFAPSALNFSLVGGSKEAGVQRSVDLIRANVLNGIFRPGAYTNIVVMSNQDDNSFVNNPPSINDRTNYVQDRLHELLCLRGNYTPPAGRVCTGFNLNLSMLRFISLVSFNEQGTSCGGISFFQRNSVYKEMSSRVHSSFYTNGFSPLDQLTRTDLVIDPQTGLSSFDSYNICDQSSFTQVFNGINTTIQDILIPHQYNFWPVASTGAAAIDPNEVQVSIDGISVPRLPSPPPAGASGFTYIDINRERNTRFAPVPGEPFTGRLIELHGNSILVHPGCITVRTQSPKEFFGYAQIQTRPIPSTIVLTINGQVIPQSATNGWQLLESSPGQAQFFSSQNIAIQSATSFCPTATNPRAYCEATPAQNRSGFFLQLFGTAVFSNGDEVNVSFTPASSGI